MGSVVQDYRLGINEKENRRISNIEPQNVEGRNGCLFLLDRAEFATSIRTEKIR